MGIGHGACQQAQPPESTALQLPALATTRQGLRVPIDNVGDLFLGQTTPTFNATRELLPTSPWPGVPRQGPARAMDAGRKDRSVCIAIVTPRALRRRSATVCAMRVSRRRQGNDPRDTHLVGGYMDGKSAGFSRPLVSRFS